MAKTQRKSKTTRRATSRKTTRGAAKSAKGKSGAKAKTTRRKTSAAKPKTARKTTAKPKTTKKKTAKKQTTRKATAKKQTAAKQKTTSRPRAATSAAKGRGARRKATTKKSTTKPKTAGKQTAAKTTKGAKATKGKRGKAAAADDTPVRKPAARTAAERRAAVMPVVPEVAEKPRSRRKKGPYTRRQLNPLRKALMELRARIVRDLNLMGDEAFRASDPEVDSDDVADMGSDAFERTMTLNLMEKDATTLKKVHDAIDLMNDGTYGLCSECNESIPLQRLEALPFAQTCVPCQEQQERLG